jgi:hypothetical protein
MNIIFDTNAKYSADVEKAVIEFMKTVTSLESEKNMPIIIFQDGVKGSYYLKCSLLASDAAVLCDLNAKLDASNPESYRANRELLLSHTTYQKMEADSSNGREFNDIIVEYNTEYEPRIPLKVWGGQHRISAIQEKGQDKNRYHGFRIYFLLSKEQRTEVALISNTNISVSNDTFDRMVEETIFGNALRNLCREVGLLGEADDFPDVGSRSEKITVKRARSFVVNFYLSKKRGSQLKSDELDRNVYDPYLATTGANIDFQYEKIMKENNILTDTSLLEAGKKFCELHSAQYKAITDEHSKTKNKKAYRNKALVESVLSGWSYVAGLLQSHPMRLNNHYRLPKKTSKIPDPLNAEEMSQFKHDSDPPTYRGLGTRSSAKDRQRIAQLFLAKSRDKNVLLDKSFMNKAVSQTVGLIALSKGYTEK